MMISLQLEFRLSHTKLPSRAELIRDLLNKGYPVLKNRSSWGDPKTAFFAFFPRDQFCLRVRDNGQGFGVGSIPASEGFGLLGMSERAERIGAQLTIRSQPGEGTEMIVTVDREASQ
jgi:glucose-6-phosphate-specific signal transduction histidine kinase